MSVKRKKLLYIKVGDVPYRNVKFLQLLPERFPNLELHTIDIVQYIKEQKLASLTNIPFIMAQNGVSPMFSKKERKTVFIRTTYFFHRLKAYLVQNINPEEYAFSFQQQSLFDASVPGLPHFIYTDHTYLANLGYEDFDPDELPPQKWLDLEKQVYANADISFVYSEYVRQSIIDQYDGNPNQVVSVGAGPKVVPSRDLQLENDDYRSKNIIFVGIDWERKGGPCLVEAFKIALQKHPDASLTIIGAEPEIDAPNCEILGRMPAAQIEAFFSKASIFCMPTKVEPFGIAFIEAMLHRLPIVGTEIGALPEFLSHGENAFLTTPGDAETLAQYLIELLDDPELCRRFGEAGYNTAIESYTWEAVADKIKKHIEGIVDIQ